MSELKEAIKKISGNHKKEFTVIDGYVISVDNSKDTFDFQPLNGGAEVHDVKLSSVENDGTTGAEVVVYPQPGSYAVIAFINGQQNNAIMINCSQVDSVKVNFSGAVTVDGPQITLNGGTNHGLVNIEPLVTKINTLETQLTALIGAFKNHKHGGVQAGGSITAATTQTAPAGIETNTVRADIEDTKITH